MVRLGQSIITNKLNFEMKHFPVDKTLNKIFLEVEEEFKDQGVTLSQISEAFYQFWYNVKFFMKSYDFPKIMLPFWGTLTGKPKKLRKRADYFAWRAKSPFAQPIDESRAAQIGAASDRIFQENNNKKRGKEHDRKNRTDDHGSDD